MRIFKFTLEILLHDVMLKKNSAMLRRVALVRAVVSEELSASRNITEDAILHSHRRENLNSYIGLTSSVYFVFYKLFRPEMNAGNG
jgi:hypothetical protein